jgi:serine/threonine-protein kinase
MPQTFGDYELLDRLAVGGMGEVYLARARGLGDIRRVCVVKRLKRELLEDPEYVSRFKDEARVLVSLSHRNLCTVTDVGRIGDELFIAMEHIPGHDLATILETARKQGTPLSRALVLYLIAEMLEALDYAHRLEDDATGRPLGLVHRDLSPQNVMVNYEGEVKLIDFGVALTQRRSEQNSGGFVLGKLHYMAPEQARGEPITFSADVFSAGVLLYESIVHERYYAGVVRTELFQLARVAAHRPRKLGEVPAPLVAVIEKATAPEPAARYGSAAEMAAALRAYAREAGEEAHAADARALMASLFPGGKQALRDRLSGLLDAAPGTPKQKTEPTVRFAAGQATEVVRERSSPGRRAPLRRRSVVPMVLAALALVVGLGVVVGVFVLQRTADPEPPVVAVARVVEDPAPAETPEEPPPAPHPEQEPEPEPAGAPGDAGAGLRVPDANGPASIGEEPPPAERAQARKARKRRARRAKAEPAPKPPDTPVRNLRQALDYLDAHCRARASCADKVLKDKGRIPLLGAEEISRLQAVALQCVRRCKR